QRGLRRDDRAAHRPDSPVERKLAERRMARETLGRQLAGRGEDRERDREVEAASLLPKTGRGKVHGDPPERPLELGARDPGAHALLRLLASLVRESDDCERWDAALQMSLDLDRPGVQADEGMSRGACQHIVEA